MGGKVENGGCYMMTGAAVKRHVLPSVLLRAGSPLVRMILGSRWHGMLDSSFLVLHVTGRGNGHRYDIPVGFVDMDMDGRLVVVTSAKWRANLRGGADVEVTLRGSPNPMHALLEEDPATVAVRFQAVIGRIGRKGTRRRLHVWLPGGREPTATELKDAAVSYGWSVITLTPR